MLDYYTILGVPPSASTEQIDEAYKKLAVKWHPEKHPENKDEALKKFKEVSEAFEVLSNSWKRHAYDELIYRTNQVEVHSHVPSGVDFTFRDPEEVFKEVFDLGSDRNGDYPEEEEASETRGTGIDERVRGDHEENNRRDRSPFGIHLGSTRSNTSFNNVGKNVERTITNVTTVTRRYLNGKMVFKKKKKKSVVGFKEYGL